MQHNEKCDCLECVKNDVFSKHVSRSLSTWERGSDNLTGKASDFIGGKLVAIKPVTVYSAPNGIPIVTVNPDTVVGTIFSYVQDGDNVWWMLDNGNFVKSGAGVFNTAILEQSIKQVAADKDAAIKAAAKVRTDANTNPLYQTGKMIQSIMTFETARNIVVGIIVLIVGSILLKIFR